MSTTSTPSGVTQTAAIAAGLVAGASVSGPTSARLAAAGIAAGAVSLAASAAGQLFGTSFTSTGTALPVEADWRVRISLQPTTAALYYANPANPIMYPLSQTNGVIFPYTPSITVTHNAKWNPTVLTHSNYNSYFYEGSEVQGISISGEFTVQDIEEGQYLAAVIQFFRSATKMFFGQSALAGTPPPVVYLDGYGSGYFPHVPCVITQFSHTMPADVDYVKVPVGVNLSQAGIGQVSGLATPTRLPAISTIQIMLQPIYSRNNIQNNFTLEKFNSGALIGNGFI